MTGFRFADVNPVTGVPYVRSLFRDLPGFAAVVVVARADLYPGEWDELVKMGEAAEFIGPGQRWVVSDAEVAEWEAAGWGDDDSVAVVQW